jgi:hydroxypyruvate reductase
MLFRRTPSVPQPPPGVEPPPDAAALLTSLYWTAVEAVAPGPALLDALARVELPRSRRVWLFALGKAAHAMAHAAVEWLRAQGVAPVGGVIVAPTAAVPPHASLALAVGDHPLPGPRSFAAAAKVGELAARVEPEDEAWVLLSGGATALAAGPESAVKPDELVELFALLHDAGLDIGRMNAIRKRFLRWGAGRLTTALAPARIRNFIVSDVIGDDLATIASGPCVPDASTAGEVRALLLEHELWDRLPLSLRRYLTSVERDASGETPKPGDPVFADVDRRIIASNRTALEAARRRAAEYGLDARIVSTSLSGTAADAGRRIAVAALARGLTPPRGPAESLCFLWGGETTVPVGHDAGVGGRSQELALAAARELALARPGSDAVSILAAGTDGRDGPTDAAGAIVTADSWDRIRAAGIDPERALAEHDAYRALDAAGALLRTGLTGTNVMDVVITLKRGAMRAAR